MAHPSNAMSNPMLTPTLTSTGEVLDVTFDHDAVRTYRGPDWTVQDASGRSLAPRAVGMLSPTHWVVTYEDVIDPTRNAIVPPNSHGWRSTLVEPCLPAGWVNAGTYSITPV